MVSPFRSDEEIVRERVAELEAERAELDALIAAARETRAGLWRRAHPLAAALLTRTSVVLALAGLAAGLWFELRVP